MKKVLIFLILIVGIIVVAYYGYLIKNKNIFVERIVSGAINEIIEDDKQARIFYMKQKGIEQKVINDKLLSLEKRYENERKKIYAYCIDKTSKQCHLYSSMTGFLFPYVGITLDYDFDKESLNLFNQKYILEYANTKGKYLGTMSGIDSLKYNNMEDPFLEYKDHFIDGGVDFKRVQKLSKRELLEYSGFLMLSEKIKI